MINITSDESAALLSILGENPHPEALAEHATQVLGVRPPQLMNLDIPNDYVVTLHEYDGQDNFYDEMESVGSRGYAPYRKVDCTDRMTLCRSTQYSLTHSEASMLSLDPRVLAVEPAPHVTGRVISPLRAEYSTAWDKSGNVTSDMKNWALLRCTNGTQIANWGSNGTVSQTANIVTTSSGKNVDIVVFDGNILPGHPEYAVNPDGTGGSRVNQFNWWSLNPQVTGDPAGTYNYSAGDAGNNGHGMHVAGIAAGNTCGWASDANIYNISPYGEQSNGTVNPSLTQLVNYIRYWHNNVKTVNPLTGRKNPTIVNMSFGSFGNFFPRYTDGILYSNAIWYRGTQFAYPATAPAGQTSLQATYNGNWTYQNWGSAGVQLYQGYIDLYGIVLFFYTNQDAAAEQAILDGAAEGIIWCAASGNSYDEAGYYYGHPNWNNSMNLAYAVIFGTVRYSLKFHNRFAVPANAQSGQYGTSLYNQICVTGNIGTLVNQQLSETSNSGPKTNIWSPGENIMSAYISAGVTDPRNPSYFLTKLTGTSMASPQTAGFLGCLAEQYPNMTQADAINYVSTVAEANVIPDPNIPLPPTNSYYNLREAPNKFLTYYYDRPISGNAWPRQRFWLRPSSGAVYPRPAIQRRNVP